MNKRTNILTLSSKVDLSSPDKMAAFEKWKLEDGSLAGLQKLVFGTELVFGAKPKKLDQLDRPDQSD